MKHLQYSNRMSQKPPANQMLGNQKMQIVALIVDKLGRLFHFLFSLKKIAPGDTCMCRRKQIGTFA